MHNVRAGGEQAWRMVGRVCRTRHRGDLPGGRLGEASLPRRMAPEYFGSNVEVLLTLREP
jgi:hypothetical protein